MIPVFCVVDHLAKGGKMQVVGRRLGLLVVAVAFLVTTVGAGTASASQALNFGSGSLFVLGESDDDRITVSVSGDTFTITDQGTGGITPGPNCSAVDANTVTCLVDPPDPAPPADPTPPAINVGVNPGSGTDSILNNTGLPLSVNWDRGDKTITSGTGNDVLNKGGISFSGTASGTTTADLGAGDDFFSSYSAGPDGPDSVIGGPGEDAFLNNARRDPIALSLDGQPNDGAPGEGDNVQGFDSLQSGIGNDVLMGDDDGNLLFGAGGDDWIFGNGGSDVLAGGNGDDFHDGGAARDFAICDNGIDTALSDGTDQLDPTCERRGAEVAGEAANVSKSGKAKVRVRCPSEEGAACNGTVTLNSNGKDLGEAPFAVANGETGFAKVELNEKGLKKVGNQPSGLLVEAVVSTDEPGGVSVSAGDIFLRAPKAG